MWDNIAEIPQCNCMLVLWKNDRDVTLFEWININYQTS